MKRFKPRLGRYIAKLNDLVVITVEQNSLAYLVSAALRCALGISETRLEKRGNSLLVKALK
jgi:hypothetical protein